MRGSGQTTSAPANEEAPFGRNHDAVADYVARARRLTDDDRVALAEAREAVSEDYHEGAVRAAAELLVGQGEPYARARAEIARAHLPEALDEDEQRWARVARLVQLALDEGLVATVVSDRLHPNHVRELVRPWWALDRDA